LNFIFYKIKIKNSKLYCGSPMSDKIRLIATPAMPRLFGLESFVLLMLVGAHREAISDHQWMNSGK
jgi:hypothetical protein